MSQPLQGKKIAILVADGFEQSEMEKPRAALDAAGADTCLISPAADRVAGWGHKEWGDTFAVDVKLGDARETDYDALLLPGGAMNLDELRRLPEAAGFARSFFAAGKPVAAISHGPALLAEADVVAGRRLTSISSIKTDLINAGAEWADETVVADEGLVTSRAPADIFDFNEQMIQTFAAGAHAGQRVI